MVDDDATAQVRQRWDEAAPRYDRGASLEGIVISDSRAWLCGRARGVTLEIAVGTGRDLEHYAAGVELTAVDISRGMLARARAHARRLGRNVDLRVADAQRLPFPDGSFDTVVCALALCTIPDQRAAIAEMWRVLRPGGRLLLVDHVEYTRAPWLWWERRRPRPRSRPLTLVRERGFVIDRDQRLRWGLVERVAAHRPD
ncbi:class I SAM-dependent methyltransferase [Spiractinospora alimapuensis]|uniref:class I SAM-dependent methyltransferase n=1 Tax=Spiractinospora alimapuensis TaxID=2820884 RepID=UPI001F27C3F6|nr:class I SAM-dependent methyltransferase [Spiractinospora alimapuensis]QVQ53922.1 class I SAM-dependent methyltransferase [Spiractinospora alimapuensis]